MSDVSEPSLEPVAAPEADALPEGQTVFDRAYVENLRKESAGYRTQLREAQTKYVSAFEGLPQADVDVFLNLAQTYRTDPTAAGQMFRQIAEGLSPAQQAAVAEDIQDAENAGEVLTPERIQSMIQEAIVADRQKAAQEQQINSVYSEIETAGFQRDSWQGVAIMHIAANQTNGDVQAAIANFQGFKQGAIDEYVQGKAAQPGYITPGTNAGTGATTPATINNLDDARRAASQYLRQNFGAQAG